MLLPLAVSSRLHASGNENIFNLMDHLVSSFIFQQFFNNKFFNNFGKLINIPHGTVLFVFLRILTITHCTPVLVFICPKFVSELI